MQTQARLYLNSREGLLVLLEQPMDFQSIVVESILKIEELVTHLRLSVDKKSYKSSSFQTS